MINDIIVTIQCIVYNHEPYLRDCLEGFVMQQTDFLFVAIVHDDASTDGSAAIIREYEERYPDIIKPIYETENQYSKHDGSLGRIMNAAIDATGAKYVAMCEGDDYWTDPLKLQKQVDFMEANPEYGLCYTDYGICDSNGDLMEESHYMNGSDKPILTFEEHLFRQGYIAPMTWLYRKDVYESITNNMLKGVSDGSYVVALEFFYHSKVAFLQINTATYRVSQGSASRPLSLQGVFKYRKGVYKIEREYAKKYLRSEWIDLFIIRQEIYELYPIAKEINDIEYLDWCHEMALEYPIIDLSIPQLMMHQQKELIQIRSSYAYRLGKSILKPINMVKKNIKKRKINICKLMSY
mgnify:CR=1 FL=1